MLYSYFSKQIIVKATLMSIIASNSVDYWLFYKLIETEIEIIT